MESRSNCTTRWLLHGGLLTIFCMGHLIVPGMLVPKTVWDPLVYEVAFLWGVAYSEIGLIATFATLGTERATYRYLFAVAFSFVAVTTLAVGIRPGNYAFVLYLHAYATFSVLALLLATWRRLAGVFISHNPASVGPMSRPSNISIGFLLIATTVAAVMITFGWHSLGRDWTKHLGKLPWNLILDTSCRLIITMILIFLPCIWIVLADRYRIHIFLSLVVLIFCSNMLIGPLFGSSIAVAFSFGLVSVLMGVLILYRREGYRIILPGREH